MKLLLLLLAVLSFIPGLQAKVLTVSNRVGASAPYKTVPDAITAATAGDTIYILGSETSYGSFTVNKRLTLIGPGHHPKKEVALTSDIVDLTLEAANAAASGTRLLGLRISQIQVTNYSQNAITIKGCYINSVNATGVTGGISSNWIIENNIFTRLIFNANKTNAYNHLIKNNIIAQGLYAANSCIISNNLFIGTQASFGDTNYAIIQNNIFNVAAPTGAANSVFNNNLTNSGANSALPYGTNSGTLNKVNVDPLFVNYPSGASFNYDFDFRLKPTSPGKNAGTDGTDIGIYGGTGFSETGEPPVPIVRSFIIQNGVVAPGGKLNVLIRAEAKN